MEFMVVAFHKWFLIPPGNRSRGGRIRSRRLESGVHGSQCVSLHFN